jgi:MSHA biogenesis protein MshL
MGSNSVMRAGKFASLSLLGLLVSSCAGDRYGVLDTNKNDPIDRNANLTREDYNNLYNLEAYKAKKPSTSGPTVSAGVMEPPIPELAEIIAAPKPPKIAATQLVSVAVTDDVPLKDVLIELSRLANVDIEVDSGITGGINFRAKDRPFNEVVERIADMAGLRYKVKNGVLRVERDLPYVQTYALDMLNIERSSTGTIGVSSSGMSGGSSGGSGGGSGGGGSSGGGSSSGNSGSTSSITAASKSDFWEKFEESISRIIAIEPNSLVSSTTIASTPAAPAAAGSPAPGALPAGASAPAAAPAAASAAATSPGAGNSSATGAFYSLNRQAGTLTVSATERQHDMVKRFLTTIEANSSSQVLIEAKIVEVSLNDDYQTGINWAQLGGTSINFTGDFDPVTASAISRSPATITILKNNILRQANLDLSAAVKLLNEYGTTRTLSSPRLNAINNQQAVLSFVENIIYFTITCEVTDAVAATATSPGTPARVETTSTMNTAPFGIILTLQPSINKSSDEVTLSVRPTLSKVTRLIADPGFELCKASAASALPAGSPLLTTLQNTVSNMPQMETRELDSILKVRSGQVMVIGGLLEDTSTNNDAGVPGLGEVPYIGNLFKSVEKINTKKELVILIRATIVDPGGNVDQADKAIYEKFTQDPRPIDFSK